MTLISDLKWRHAVKAYDPSKKVSTEDIEKIIEATRLAPTSSGLQPFKLVVVSNQALKEQMVPGSLNPDCMRDCSHILVFAAWDQYTDERIDEVYDRTTDQRGLPRGRFSRYTDMLKESFGRQTTAQHFAHISKQTYIALGFALAQAAELRISSTPAEGYDNELIDDVLNLKEQGLRSVALLYLGYANEEKDWLAQMKKKYVLQRKILSWNTNRESHFTFLAPPEKYRSIF